MTTNNVTSSSTGGLGFCGALTILFIGLKLTGFLTWSWLWVLAPLWIPFIFVILLLVITVVILAIGG